jgi:type I restriction enzyme R subunit
MNEEQKRQLSTQIEKAEDVEYRPEQLDRDVFVTGTTHAVLELLMEEGIREATGSRIGKTIVFARNHDHAVHLAEEFSKLYPQYGSDFCRVIDNQEPKAEQLIDDFKNPENKLTIAISVDMLDTGIDVPEVVNLVFAKPVKSLVKFWQMIGRGTRLSKGLFGPGKDKTEFLIFDHWSNFQYFDEEYREPTVTTQKSMLQYLFEERIAIAEAALENLNEPVFQATVDLIVQDVRSVLDANCIEVRAHWKELEILSVRERIAQFEAVTGADLRTIAAPLMQWRDIRGDEDAYRFDLLMARLESALLRGEPEAGRVLDYKDRTLEQIQLLMKNQNPVKERAETIQRVRSKAFWSDVTVPQLEDVRRELRGIMKYQEQRAASRLAPLVFDVDDAQVRSEDYVPRLEGLDLFEYRRRVESLLKEMFKDHPVLQRVRAGKAVREDELEELARLVLEHDDKANIKHLAGHDPHARRSLLAVFRGLVGIDAEAVAAAFTAFVHKHPRLSSQQLHFLQLLQNHIAQNGGIEIDRLYQAPFTTLHAESVDGVFTSPGQVDELLNILSAFEAVATPSAPPPASQAS